MSKSNSDECVLCGEKPTERPLRVWSLQELLAMPPTKNGQAINLLCEAIRCLQRDYEGAAWRVADALYLLSKKWPDAGGIGEPTGRGAMLVVRE